MLKICQGLSALGCRILRRLSSWIFWWWKAYSPRPHRAYSTRKVYIPFSFHIFLFLSFLVNIGQRNAFPGYVWHFSLPPWACPLPLSPREDFSCPDWESIILLLSRLMLHCRKKWLQPRPAEWGGVNLRLPHLASRQCWSVSTMGGCQGWEIIPPKHISKIWRVSPQPC